MKIGKMDRQGKERDILEKYDSLEKETVWNKRRSEKEEKGTKGERKKKINEQEEKGTRG